MIGNNQSINPWEKYEEEYLIKNYQLLSKFEMKVFLNKRTANAIKRKMFRMGLKRTQIEGHNIKIRLQTGSNHWNYGGRNTTEGRKKMKISQRKRFESANERARMKEIRSKQIFPKINSSIEVKIQTFLTQLKIEFFTHQYMKIEHGYQCDILIPSMNMVIECDGDYWHGNPEKFKGDKLTEKMIKQREKDEIRTKELIKKGYNILRLWEYEIKAMDINEFNNKLANQNIYKV